MMDLDELRQVVVSACDYLIEKIRELIRDEDMLDEKEYDERVQGLITLEN